MDYSPTTRVVHVNEVAGVASALVSTAQSHQHHWSVRPLPALRPPLVPAAFKRLLDVPRWYSERRHFDLVHIHYGPNGYLGWGASQPTVLHLHGSDVRSDLRRPIASTLMRRSLAAADVVVYSTQDLADAVREYRPDALWLPNPLPQQLFAHPLVDSSKSERLVFATRWDATKGAAKLAGIARILTEHDIECHGLDWGADASLAREAGVILHPHMSLDDYLAFLGSARLVIGQISFGVPGLSELQAMSLGVPVAMYAPGVPVYQIEDSADAELLLSLWGDEESLASLGMQGSRWAREHHSPDRVFEQLVGLYQRLLT